VRQAHTAALPRRTAGILLDYSAIPDHAGPVKDIRQEQPE
jgi:hypothetical protein